MSTDTVGPPAVAVDPAEDVTDQMADAARTTGPGPLVTVAHIYLTTGRVIRWKLSQPTRFIDVVRPLDQDDGGGQDVTALYIEDAATGQPVYIRMAHIVDISPEVGDNPAPTAKLAAPWAPQTGGGR
jgi:hypothetical protein